MMTPKRLARIDSHPTGGKRTTADHDTLINRLPYELLRHIFLLTLTLSSPRGVGATYHEYILDPSLSKEPMSFTYICSRWCAVALAIPELWTAVSGAPNRRQTTKPGVLRVWMRNMAISSASSEGTAVFPLDLHLPSPIAETTYYGNFRKMREERRAVLRLFWRQIHKCRSPNLVVNKNLLPLLESLVKRIGPRAVLLEDVELTFADISPVHRSTARVNVLISWLKGLPSLRRLTWDYTLPYCSEYRDPDFNIEGLPWNTLEEITFKGTITFARMANCLSRCSNAKSVTVSAFRCHIPFPALLARLKLPPLTTLPRLTSLCLNTAEAPWMFLDYLCLPELRSLTLRGFQSRRRFPTRIADFLNRSDCHLERLAILTSELDQTEAKLFFSIPQVARITEVDLNHASSIADFQDYLELGNWKAYRDAYRILELIGWTDVDDAQLRHREEHE